MKCIWLIFLMFCVCSCAIRGVDASPRRNKREDMLLRRLRSVIIRVENLELGLHTEQEASRAMQTELKMLKTEANEKKSSAHDGRRGLGEMSEDVVRKVADLARNELRTDLAVITSGLIAEKHNAAEMTDVVRSCKTGLSSFTSRLDGFRDTMVKNDGRLDAVDKTVIEIGDRLDGVDEILTDFGHEMDDADASISQLNIKLNDVNGTLITVNNNITNLNTTLTDLKTNCSKSIAPMPGTGVTSVKCPVRVVRQASRTPGKSVLGQVECNHRYKYVYLMNVGRIRSSSQPHTRSAFATIATGIKIGIGHVYRGKRIIIQLSSDCNWPSMKEDKLYWIFSDKQPGEESNRGHLDLQGTVIMEFQTTSKRLNVFVESILYSLQRGDWNRLCGVQ